MNYSEYPGHKTFVVQHTTGFGDQGGAPTEWLEIIGSYDTREEAMAAALEKFPRDPSGWTWDNFDIHVNSLTPEGKLIHNQWKMESEIRAMKFNEHPENYHVFDDGTFKVIIEKNAAFDSDNIITTSPALQSYKMIFLDTNEIRYFIQAHQDRRNTVL